MAAFNPDDYDLDNLPNDDDQALIVLRSLPRVPFFRSRCVRMAKNTAAAAARFLLILRFIRSIARVESAFILCCDLMSCLQPRGHCPNHIAEARATHPEQFHGGDSLFISSRPKDISYKLRCQSIWTTG